MRQANGGVLHVRRRSLPPFITELWEDPTAFRTLVSACVAIAAVGLDPHILDPGMPSIRVALGQDESVRSLLMVSAVIQAGLLLLGGYLADRYRSERLLRAALAGLAITSVLAIPLGVEALVIPIRAIAWLCGGLVLPFAIGAIAIAYSGPARATALGAAYGVLGASTAAWPALATINGATGSAWPAFALCAIAAVIAWVANRHLPDMPAAEPRHRSMILAVALFSFGVVAMVASVIQYGSQVDGLRVATFILGLACVVVALVPRAARRGAGAEPSDTRVDLRPVAVALAVGVVIGFAQAGPMLQLPQFFTYIQGSDPLVATIAVAPFVVALLVAGPLSGWMLQRIRPRSLIAGGAVAIGLANILLAAILYRGTGYPWFIIPYLLIGAGFVIATTVRTAVIFASVPKGLPASAAALNEASIGMGSRIGVVVALVATTTVAMQDYAAQVAGMSRDTAASELRAFRRLLEELNLRPMVELVAGLDVLTLRGYEDAVVEGMRWAWFLPGVVAIVTGILAWVAMGARDPVQSVWELADERPVPVPGEAPDRST